MIKIGIKSDIKKVTSRLNDIQRKQIPFATAKALTSVGQKIKQAEKEEMQKVFDRPTRFTLNSLFLKRATKRQQKAIVWLRDWAPKGTPANTYLGPQIYAGRRNLKGFEKLLNAKGVLPDGYYTVPAKNVRKDAYGNISKGLLNQILSYSGAQRDYQQNTKQGRRRQTRARFIILDEDNGKAGGIWAVTADRRIYPVLIFVKQPQYERRFDFFKVARDVYEKNMVREFDMALEFAIKTAR